MKNEKIRNEILEKIKHYQVFHFRIPEKLSQIELEYLKERYSFDNKTNSYLFFFEELRDEKIRTNCKVCNQFLGFERVKNRNVCCSTKCSKADPDYIAKTKATLIERYGADNISKTEYGKQKKRETCLKNLGVENPFQSDICKEKAKQTQLAKYGYIHNFSAPEVMQDFRDTLEKKYGVRYNRQVHLNKENLHILDNLQEYLGKSEITLDEFIQVMKLTNLSDSGLLRRCEQQGISIIETAGSFRELDFIQYIESLLPNVEIIRNMKRAWNSRYELDLYIPSKNIAFEFDGIYWHSSSSKEKDNYLSKRHLNKTNLCEKNGVQLFHIFENEWLDPVKNPIWKSTIKAKLGLIDNKIYARNCEKREITAKEAMQFCELNHLQGGLQGSKYLGLFHQDELVQVAILGKPRYSQLAEIELIRLCSKLNTVVVGGSSKLLKGFDSILSYANRRWSRGNVYSELGFKLVKMTAPNYFYWKNKTDLKLLHRSNFQKSKLGQILDKFDPNLTEQENMYNNGYKRIWDCGNLVYLKEWS